jgi:hypothetical protein
MHRGRVRSGAGHEVRGGVAPLADEIPRRETEGAGRCGRRSASSTRISPAATETDDARSGDCSSGPRISDPHNSAVPSIRSNHRCRAPACATHPEAAPARRSSSPAPSSDAWAAWSAWRTAQMGHPSRLHAAKVRPSGHGESFTGWPHGHAPAGHPSRRRKRAGGADLQSWRGGMPLRACPGGRDALPAPVLPEPRVRGTLSRPGRSTVVPVPPAPPDGYPHGW